MRIADSNGDLLLFRSSLLTIAAVGRFQGIVGSTSIRVRDAEGTDISHITRLESIEETPQRNWAILELDRPGFDGQFCVGAPSLGIMG